MYYSAFYMFVPVTFENMDEQQAFGVSNQASFKHSGYRFLFLEAGVSFSHHPPSWDISIWSPRMNGLGGS